MPALQPFPRYKPCEAEAKIDDLDRLLNPTIFRTQYMDARSGGSLVATGLRSFASYLSFPRWNPSVTLATVANPRARMNPVCAALFDLVCNAEYIYGRVTNVRWFYCNRHRQEGSAPEPYAYFSFLKQCPACCQDRGCGSAVGFSADQRGKGLKTQVFPGSHTYIDAQCRGANASAVPVEFLFICDDEREFLV